MAERRFPFSMRPLLSGAVPWLAWIALIFGLSAQSQPALSPYTSFLAFPHADKLLHFSEYAVLGALTLRMLALFRPSERRWPFPTLADALVMCAAIACLDELSQRLSPGRSPDVADVLADCIGAAAGALAWRCLSQRILPRR